MRNFFRGCIVFVFMLAPTAVWAVHPFQVENTVTQGKGNYLLELNGDYRKDNSIKTTTLAGVITAGAGEQTDLSLEAPYLMLNPSPVTERYERGEGDARLKLKQRIFENEVKQSMGFQIYTDLPTGSVDRGLGTNNVVWGATLMDQQECHNKVIYANVGYEVFGRDIKAGHFAKNYAVLFGMAVEHKLTGSFRVLTELKGEMRKKVDTETDATGAETAENSRSRPFTFMTGMLYDITKSWYVDLGVRAGLNKYAEDYTVLAGTAWRF